MHDPADAAHTTEIVDEKFASLSPEPDPVSPVGFSLMARLLGLAIRMALAPWLETGLHRQIRNETEENHE